MDVSEARGFLSSLLNHYLRITASDGRMFYGQFKCTDASNNVILGHTYEYRQPSSRQVSEAAQMAAGPFSVGMQSRYLGLVVVPGDHITEILLEEFASQMKK